MLTRELILQSIRRLAEQKDGQPPGVAAFTAATGITQSQWRGVFWARWSDALAEAGHIPNRLQGKKDTSFVLLQVIQLTRKMARLPTFADMRLYRRTDAAFPNDKTISSHFGGTVGVVNAIRAFCEANAGHEDVLRLLPAAERLAVAPPQPGHEGLVYLLKSGPHFKIGRSETIERRLKEITVALPETVTLMHAIRTDDPSGIEAYWHRRFRERRVNGEWFKLTAADIAAFRRRKFQ